METFETRLIEVIPRTHYVKSFRLEAKSDLGFQAGQFMAVTIPINGKEQTKYFSFSNSPTESGYWEFTKKITSSEFSQELNHLKPGDALNIKMPLGNFILDTNLKIAFLSGGIGITPIRSMCKYIIDKKLSYDTVLIYGNRTPDDIIFKEDLDLFNRIGPNHRVVYTLNEAPKNKQDWQGRIGFIDAPMIRAEIPDFAQRKFYVCGPPQMVDHLAQILKDDLDILPQFITKENFAGY